MVHPQPLDIILVEMGGANSVLLRIQFGDVVREGNNPVGHKGNFTNCNVEGETLPLGSRFVD